MKTFARAIAVTAAVLGSPVHADPAPVTIVVFNPPSLGSIFPSVIKAQLRKRIVLAARLCGGFHS